jgi:hypothetical protein
MNMISLATNIRSSIRLRAGAASLAVIVLMPAVSGAQETRQATAGPEYKGSPTQRRWFGDGYRDAWTTPFDAPVLNLATEGGGLEPVRTVGQLQTAGLALRGADGKSYTFRSLHKEPERLLPIEWRNSWPARMLRDATSATHPGAAVMLPVLSDAAGIPHTVPRLVVMPDDPRLGKFREAFANQLGTIEEYPTAASGGYPGFHNATQIISTSELWKRWLQGPGNRIDTRAFLRARILDLFVENYDRRRGQWRWMRIPGQEGWQPLPEDPDMVFVRHDGLMASSMRSRQPRLLEFSEKYPKNLEGPTSNAAEVDRWLLTDLPGDVFEQTARELQAAWTDEVIDRTVAQMPKEWQAADKGFLARALRARRAGLVEYVHRFYRYLARDVDVHLTDRDEHITIATGSDGATTLTASVNGEAPYYSRRFRRGETDEVRVYLHGGNDRVERTGPGGPVNVRIIAGPGATTIQSADTTSEVWTGGGEISGSRVDRVGPWTNPEPVKDAPWIEPRSYGSWTIGQPRALVAPDVGLAIGGSLTRTNYGFRTEPFASEQTIAAGWSFGASSAKAQYDGTFHRPASSLGYAVRAFASGIEQLNYFGFGNDTREQPRSLYHSRQTVYSAAPALDFVFSPRLSLSAGPEIRYVTSGQAAGSLLAQEQPYGTGDFGLVSLRGGLRLDTRRVATAALMTSAAAEEGETPDLVPGRAVLAVVSGFATPPAWDVKETYGGVDGSIAGSVSGAHLQLAARVGGQRRFGTYPWFDAASLGSSTDRGYRSHRFAGDSSLYGNVEVRAYMGPPRFESIFPIRFGVVGFVDVGRVWLEGENSQKWHPSAGGGVLAKPVGTAIVLRAVVADGDEGILLYIGSGFRF